MTNHEPIHNQELKLLYEKYIANEVSEEEFNRLYDVLLLPDKEVYLKELMAQEWQLTSAIPGFDKDTIPLPARVIDMPARNPVKRFIRFAAAIAVMLLLGSGIYYWVNPVGDNDKNNKSLTAIAIENDALPGTDRATLTLADGSIILVDSVANGNLGSQGNTQIVKLDSGQLAYNINSYGTSPGNTLYNTIATPRGGQFSLILPDGSKVWLNAASSLKFPVVFSGNNRIVELSGEGYFEVVKNSRQPFQVKVNEAVIEVLGTSFNVNSYAEEDNMSTTLIEGSVKVISNGGTSLLKPGQQANMDKNAVVSVKTNVNTAAVVAWKEGYFIFDEVDIKMVMRQIARWYNMEVKYSDRERKETYYGKIKRNTKLSEVLKVLEESEVSFTVNGNLITVNE